MTDFNTTINRKNTHSVKWDDIDSSYNIQHGSDILPMWIADMDFSAPNSVINALKDRIQHGVFGYTFLDDDGKSAIQQWVKKKHDWDIERSWIHVHSGVVSALASIIDTFTQEKDGVLITPPVYPPFAHLPENMGRELIECNLVEDNGDYSIDFHAFEQALKKNVKVFLLCNPHNPGGIVWKDDVLHKIVALCETYNVLIVSDEIHSDLVFSDYKHTPLSKIAKGYNGHIITCIAPTKTFNLAGIQTAFTVASNDKINDKLSKYKKKIGIMGTDRLSPFAEVAIRAAYKDGEIWIQDLLDTVSQNMDYVINELEAYIPGIKIKKPESTYLLWIDYRNLGIEEEEIMSKLLNLGGLALEPGSKYGDTGKGFLRMNVACSYETVKEAVSRFKRAVSVIH